MALPLDLVMEALLFRQPVHGKPHGLYQRQVDTGRDIIGSCESVTGVGPSGLSTSVRMWQNQSPDWWICLLAFEVYY
jgi:hypothetical protein